MKCLNNTLDVAVSSVKSFVKALSVEDARVCLGIIAVHSN